MNRRIEIKSNTKRNSVDSSCEERDTRSLRRANDRRAFQKSPDAFRCVLDVQKSRVQISHHHHGDGDNAERGADDERRDRADRILAEECSDGERDAGRRWIDEDDHSVKPLGEFNEISFSRKTLNERRSRSRQNQHREALDEGRARRERDENRLLVQNARKGRIERLGDPRAFGDEGDQKIETDGALRHDVRNDEPLAGMRLDVDEGVREICREKRGKNIFQQPTN